MIRRVAGGEVDAPVLTLDEHLAAQELRVGRERHAALAGLEGELGELLMRALGRLVHDELALRPEHVRAIGRAELARLARATQVELRVHPEDMARVEPLRDDPALPPFTIAPDGALERGDVMVASSHGHVDARMRVKLSRLAALLESVPPR
jgi:flagellar assembly protein FliH